MNQLQDDSDDLAYMEADLEYKQYLCDHEVDMGKLPDSAKAFIKDMNYRYVHQVMMIGYLRRREKLYDEMWLKHWKYVMYSGLAGMIALTASIAHWLLS